jgi:hypothetical protein
MSESEVLEKAIPFSLTTLELGRSYGKIFFTVNQESHQKTVDLLLGSMEQKPAEKDPYPLLLPSELWAMARVFSQSFGKLNEVGLARAVWRIEGSAKPSCPLTASATVTAKIPKGSLAFCGTQTDTLDESGKLLMRADDKILMVHDCEKPFFVEPAYTEAPVPGNVLYRNRHTVNFRYEWDPSVWINNIQVDEYAQHCGFERGLPEFIIFMDWIYHAGVQCNWIGDDPFVISLHKILPMYRDDIIDVLAYEHSGCLQIRLLRTGMERIVAKVRRI